jgi:hypothetical protein
MFTPDHEQRTSFEHNAKDSVGIGLLVGELQKASTEFKSSCRHFALGRDGMRTADVGSISPSEDRGFPVQPLRHGVLQGPLDLHWTPALPRPQ